MNIIAIDCGASFVKGALIKDDIICKTTNRKSPNVSMNILEVNQISSLISLVRETIDELIDGLDKAYLGVSNEMHGFILCDAKGVPCIDYISWQKEYGDLEIDDFTCKNLLGESVLSDDIKHTGMPLRSGLPSCNLMYLIKKGIIDTSKLLYFYTLGDFIVKELTGADPFCHPTNAAATGLYDIINDNWNRNIISFIGAEKIIFPNIGYEPLKCIYKKTELSVFPAIGDQQCALLGADFKNVGDISFNLGTGAQVSVITNKNNLGEGYQIRPFFYDSYIKTIPHIPSGRALNVYFRFVQDVLCSYGINLEESDIWDKIINLDINVKETYMNVDLSFFSNAITDRTTGAIENIGEYDLTFESLFVSVLSQMIRNYISIAHRLVDDFSVIERIVFSGGVAARFETIRNGIISLFPQQTDVYVSKNETMIGIKKYIESSQENVE